MGFEDKEIEIITKVSIGDLIDNIVEMKSEQDILIFMLKIDNQLEDHDFSMDLIISLIENMSGEFKKGDTIKIRNAVMTAQVKEGKQCSL
jgi:hypothetical protein